MRILIAPNSFKHALSSLKAAEMIQRGLERSRLSGKFEPFPIADGGNDTMELLVNRLDGQYVTAEVFDPLMRRIKARFGYFPSSNTAVVEMAEASGIHLLKPAERDPLKATSYGTGELMRHALNKGATKLILGLGGSATVDGGAGILQALGVKLLDKSGNSLQPGAEGLARLEEIDTSEADSRLKNCEIIVACDVNSPLLGKKGAAAVFGPQKGATEEGVRALEQCLANFSEKIEKFLKIKVAELPKSGAAGGASAGLYAFFNARLENGLEYLLEITQFEEALREADLLITAEGKLDSQTLEGKGPFGVAKMAKKYNLPVIVLAGQVLADGPDSFHEYFDAVFPINFGLVSLEEAIKNTGTSLSSMAYQVGNLLALKFKQE